MATSYVYKVTDELLQQAVRRILAIGSPEKIILFGSRARGDAKPDSDLDLLVIDADRELEDEYRKTVRELGVPVDLIVQTAVEVASWRNVHNHFLTKAVREGRVLYKRQIDLLRETPPARSPADHARELIQLADRDLDTAEWLLQGDRHPVSICFHVQQAIEKYLKSILAFDGADVPRTHNLEELRQLLAQSPRRLEIDPRVDVLSPFAVRGRYEILLKADAPFAAAAVDRAREIRRLVARELPPEAIPAMGGAPHPAR